MKFNRNTAFIKNKMKVFIYFLNCYICSFIVSRFIADKNVFMRNYKM